MKNNAQNEQFFKKSEFSGIFCGFVPIYYSSICSNEKSMYSGLLKVLSIWNRFYFVNLVIFGDPTTLKILDNQQLHVTRSEDFRFSEKKIFFTKKYCFGQ